MSYSVLSKKQSDTSDDEYNTDLKKLMFKKSEEYNKKINELKKLKHETLNKLFYMTVGNEDNCETHFGSCSDPILSFDDYNIKKRGINVRFDSTNNSPFFYSFKTEWWGKGLNGTIDDEFTQSTFLPLSEEKGLLLENGNKEVSIYLIFKITGIKKVRWQSYITADPIQILIANKQSGEIYYSRTFNNKKLCIGTDDAK